jgi:hypothetical protein
VAGGEPAGGLSSGEGSRADAIENRSGVVTACDRYPYGERTRKCSLCTLRPNEAGTQAASSEGFARSGRREPSTGAASSASVRRGDASFGMGRVRAGLLMAADLVAGFRQGDSDPRCAACRPGRPDVPLCNVNRRKRSPKSFAKSCASFGRK